MVNKSYSHGRILFVLLLSNILGCILFAIAETHAIQQSRHGASNVVRNVGSFGLPSHNLLEKAGGTTMEPKGSDSLYVSDGMLRGILPLIPNFQFGFLYDIGNNRISLGRLTADYLLPIRLGTDSTLFGEAHAEFQEFWKVRKSIFTSGTTTITNSSFNSRLDVSLGGGYRTPVRRDTLLGVNGFYDASQLGETWYSSGGLGLEMAALIGSNDAIDLNLNWYGQLFNKNVIRNAFKYGPSNYDLQVGYSRELWNEGPDLRLKMTCYHFNIGTSIYGWNAGAELKSRDGVFVLRYDVGHDKVNQTYQTVGGFVSVGFQLENMFRIETPFAKPEPIFRTPRCLRYMLIQPVKRDWHQSVAVVVTRQGESGGICNLEQLLAEVAVTSPGGHSYLSGYIPLTPVPHACLDPAKFIVVEFDYTFDSAPAGGIADWGIAVSFDFSSIVSNAFIATDVPTAQSGHMSFTLNKDGSPTLGQSAFTLTSTDPKYIVLGAYGNLTTNLTITNVAIHFNQ